ncbi:MAG: PQQ-binding-like beta-propeller repeat protein [Propionibacteriaceae bacterium]|nr:PQQ-binding-like beta-propeller repeat protein [Propionibacteriaceae bacterium]
MRGWLSGGTIVVLFAWVLFAATLVTVPGSAEFSGPESAFVPADGSADRVVIGGTPGKAASIEHALVTGIGVSTEMPPAVIRLMRPPEGVDRGALRWWRETMSPNTPNYSPMMTLRGVQAGDGVRLYAHTGPHGVVFRPGLLELPLRPAPGQTWTSTGTVADGQGAVDYHNKSTAAAPTDPGLLARGCLNVTSTTTAGGAPRTDVATWCPDRGIVEGSPALGENRAAIASDRWPEVGRVVTDATWPRHGTVVTPEVVDGDPTFGTEAAVLDLGVRTGGGVTSAGTLVTITPGTTLRGWLPRHDELTGVWWGGPGGAILSLTVLDNFVLATTSERTLVAYDQNGRRLWSRRTPDLVPGGISELGRNRIVFGTVTGDLIAVDLTTGDRVWTTGFPGGSHRAPSVVEELVLVHTDDAWTAFDADGRQRWTSAEITHPIGIVAANDALWSLSVAGESVWLDPETGEILRTGAFAYGKGHQRLLPGPAGTAALISDDGVRLIAAESARQLQFIEGATAVRAEADGWRVLTPPALLRFDPRGAELDRLELTPPAPGATDMIPVRGTLWLLHPDGVAWVR